MARVIDYAAWQEKIGEHSTRKGVKFKTGTDSLEWKGYVKIDPLGKSDKEIDDACVALNIEYKKKWAQRIKDLNLEDPYLPKSDTNELSEWLARGYREIYGRDQKDGTPLTQPKQLDILKLAAQFDITPGEPGWAEKIVALVRDDKHSGETDD